VINDTVAIDAGSLAMACTENQRAGIRDIVLSHAHLDHIAGLPLFIDDLYSVLAEPVRVHASQEVIDVLERDIFNWSVYPRFSELENDFGPVMAYRPFKDGADFSIKGLTIKPLAVNHQVPASGFIISDSNSTIAMSGDTSAMDQFWPSINTVVDLKALLIECAFPNDLQGLAEISHHLTPRSLAAELEKFERDCPIHIINIKPAFRDTIIEQIYDLKIANIVIFEVGRIYDL
jgi:cAMP phosphodiesterase